MQSFLIASMATAASSSAVARNSFNLGDLAGLLGHFHPLLVHLPIGGLILLAFLELVAGLTRWKRVADNTRWILGFVSGTAVASAACGWMLAQGGGYDSQILKWHRTLGLALGAACLMSLLFRQREWLRAYRASLCVSFFLLVVASHLGGSITHGRGFLTRIGNKSERVAFRLAARDLQAATAGAERPAFASVIAPILRQRCAACHGSEKHKAGLRLDTLEGLLGDAKEGPAITHGPTKESLLIERILLPLDADGHMPPEDQPQPTPEEIALIVSWLKAGAPLTTTVADLKSEPDFKHLLEVVSKTPDGTHHGDHGESSQKP